MENEKIFTEYNFTLHIFVVVIITMDGHEQ